MTEMINFTQLTDTQSDMVLSWRNNEMIRKWMLNKSIISQQEHNTFLKTLKQTEKSVYFLIKEDDKYIGVINFKEIKQLSVSMGLYANPSLKSYGNKLMTSIVNYAFNTLRKNEILCEVFIDNELAYNLYKKFNFQEYSRTKELIQMKLCKIK